MKTFWVLILGALLGLGGTYGGSRFMEARRRMMMESDVRIFSMWLKSRTYEMSSATSSVFASRSDLLKEAEAAPYLERIMYLPLPGAKVEKGESRQFVAWSYEVDPRTSQRFFILTNFTVEQAAEAQVDWVTQELSVR